MGGINFWKNYFSIVYWNLVISFSRKHHLPITYSMEHEAPTFNLNWSIELCKVNARWINLSISYFCFWLCMGSFSTSLFTLDLLEQSLAHQLANPSQTMERIGQKFRNNYCVALRQWKRIKNHRSSCLSKQLGSTVSHRQPTIHKDRSTGSWRCP